MFYTLLGKLAALGTIYHGDVLGKAIEYVKECRNSESKYLSAVEINPMLLEIREELLAAIETIDEALAWVESRQ